MSKNNIFNKLSKKHRSKKMSKTLWDLDGLVSISDFQEIRNVNKSELLKSKRYIDYESILDVLDSLYNNNKVISGPFDAYRDMLLNIYKKSKSSSYERLNALNLSIEFTTSEEIYEETGLYGVEICGDDITFIGNTDMIVYFMYDLLNCKINSNSKLCILDYGDRSLPELSYIFDLATYLSNPRVILEFENDLNSDSILKYLCHNHG